MGAVEIWVVTSLKCWVRQRKGAALVRKVRAILMLWEQTSLDQETGDGRFKKCPTSSVEC